MSAESLELLKIEKRLEQYTLEEKRIEKEKKSQQRQEKIRIRNVFDANSSNPLKKLRYKITVFLNKKR